MTRGHEVRARPVAVDRVLAAGRDGGRAQPAHGRRALPRLRFAGRAHAGRPRIRLPAFHARARLATRPLATPQSRHRHQQGGDRRRRSGARCTGVGEDLRRRRVIRFREASRSIRAPRRSWSCVRMRSSASSAGLPVDITAKSAFAAIYLSCADLKVAAAVLHAGGFRPVALPDGSLALAPAEWPRNRHCFQVSRLRSPGSSSFGKKRIDRSTPALSAPDQKVPDPA